MGTFSVFIRLSVVLRGKGAFQLIPRIPALVWIYVRHREQVPSEQQPLTAGELSDNTSPPKNKVSKINRKAKRLLTGNVAEASYGKS